MDAEAPRKRRRKPKPLRFAQVKVGDILIHKRKTLNAFARPRPVPIANDDPVEVEYVAAIATSFAIVTDLWWDPVYGQAEESAGQMVGCQYWVGGGIGSKWSHNRLGLARAGWDYATPDQIADAEGMIRREERLRQALRAGEVSPIRG